MTTAAPAESASPLTPAAPRAAVAVHQGLAMSAVRLHGGVLGAWQERNAAATIPHCIDQLEESGVLDNFRRVLGNSEADYRGFVFADSDLYKVIEAVGWEIARSGTTEFDAWLDEVIALVARVQEPDGYVMTWIQGVHPGKRFAELEWTHEMYVAGHLIQAAIALDRAAGRTDLLEIARAFADLLVRTFGPEGTDGICGHPQIETALIELYRHTGERRYLDLATRMIDLRGTGLLKVGGLGARYFQDHEPVRSATDAAGHAVRQLYLNAGVTDLYLETGEQALAEAMEAQWHSAHERKMYISGAFGSRHRDEAFGSDYELPPDRAYAETCATIADMHWAWRMMLAFGPGPYAETIEREIHNALRASVDASGTRFFYSNPLQMRPDRTTEVNAPKERTSWYECACCPPNIARVIAQLSAYLASSTEDTLWLHVYAAADIDLPGHLGSGVVQVRTDYPRSGRVQVSLDGGARPGAHLALRIPSWSGRTTFDGEEVTTGEDGYLHLPLGSGGVLELDMSPRWTAAHPRVDAVRGCLAAERGPVVYCLEQADLPEGIDVDDVIVDASHAPQVSGEGDLAPMRVAATHRPARPGLYRPASESGADGDAPVRASLIPFGHWGNRGAGAMRVWLPVDAPPESS